MLIKKPIILEKKASLTHRNLNFVKGYKINQNLAKNGLWLDFFVMVNAI